MHRLDLGVVLESVGAKLTAETGLLEATEGSLVGDHVVAVDPDSTVKEVSLMLDKASIHKVGTYPAFRALETRIAVLTFLVWTAAARP